MIPRRLLPGWWARVLEVAPGAGLPRPSLVETGKCSVEAVDVSRSFVRIATRNAERAGVAVTSPGVGDVHALPYPRGQFDAVVCRAAFKNYARPVVALQEMRRVLRTGGMALVIDLRADVANMEIDGYGRDPRPGLGSPL